MATIYDFSAKTIDGDEQKLSAYRGKTLLIVNVASKCGFTGSFGAARGRELRVASCLLQKARVRFVVAMFS